MTKNTISVTLLVAVLAPTVLWLGATTVTPIPDKANVYVSMGWSIGESNEASALLPTGQGLPNHPDYQDFKQAVRNLIKAEIPEERRNAWPFQKFEVDENGHKPESEVRDFLIQQLDLLNLSRDDEAEEAGLPNPPDFTLTTGMPFLINYDYSQGIGQCGHMYKVSLGGVPLTHSDLTIGATAYFYFQAAWKSDL